MLPLKIKIIFLFICLLITFGKISTGALNDLERVTKQAYAMVSYFGMSKVIGNRSYYDSSGQAEYAFVKPFSEKTSETIDKEVSTIIEDTYNRAKDVLIENREGLTQLATLLLEKEVIFSEDLERIFGKRKYAGPHEHQFKAEEKIEKLLGDTPAGVNPAAVNADGE